MFDQNLIVGLVVLAVVVLGVYAYAPKLRAMMSGAEGFESPYAHASASSASGSGRSMTNGRDANGSPLSGQGEAGRVADRMGGAAVPNPSAAQMGDYARYSGEDSLGAVPMPAAAKPQGCYPRESMTPDELLPKDQNSQWAQANPAGSGDIQGKNFLSAGALIGVNTVGQSLRNANLQLRAEPPNPQMPPGPWNIPTIQPDLQRRALE